MLARKQIPPLEAVRAFEAAARHGSFALAAQEANVTPGAMSYQVKRLEAWLGQPLFERKPNGIELTPRGRAYAEQVRAAFDELIATSREVKEHDGDQAVSICAQHSLTTLWLLPKAQQLRDAFNLRNLQITVGEDRVSAKSSADITIFHHRAEQAGYVQTHLLTGQFRVYAAPALARRARARGAQDYASHPWINLNMTERGWRYPTFEAWFAAANLPPPHVAHGLTVNLMHLATSACIRGDGFALLLDAFCVDAVASGALVALPGPALDSPHAYFLRYKRNASERVKQVAAWLVEAAQRAPHDSRQS